jgi:tripartite-type tricarboxylate transporter receptor subunit TctC
MKTRQQTRLLVAAAMCALPALAMAQAYPVKPVRVIVTVPAGGAADVIMRLVAPKAGEHLGQPIIVENRTSMSGVLASEQVSQMAPDGYNLLFTTPSSQITVKFLSKNVRYDAEKDFTPITAFVDPVSTLVVHPSIPANDLKEFIEYAKRNPGKLAYGSAGVGSVFHLTTEAFLQATGTQLLHVPYKGVINAVNDLAGGQIQMALSAFPNVRPYVASGKLKLLAWMGSRRFSAYPDVPAVGEVVPGYEQPPSFFGLFGPAGLPRPIVQRLNTDMVKVLTEPDMKAKLEGMGNHVVANTPEEFAAQIRRGVQIFGSVVKKAGLKPED